MSVWSHITGVIHIEGTTTETELLSRYSLLSHHLVGSEGGLHISFTRTQNQENNREFKIEPYTELRNMVIQGHLRNFGEEKLTGAVEALKEYLYDLKERYLLGSASFTLECDESPYFYHLTYVKNRIRVKKVRIK